MDELSKKKCQDSNTNANLTLFDNVRLLESIKPYWREQIKLACSKLRACIDRSDSPYIHSLAMKKYSYTIADIIRHTPLHNSEKTDVVSLSVEFLNIYEPEVVDKLFHSAVRLELETDIGGTKHGGNI